MFPTYVVGSLPRPRWVRDLIEDRKVGRLAPAEADRALDAAVPCAIALQERAGLDFVSDGEWRRESYVKVFCAAVAGFQADVHTEQAAAVIAAPSYPAVVAPLRPERPIAVTEARFLTAQATRRTLVAIPSPYTLGRRLWTPEHSAEAYETREAFVAACIPIVRDEVRALLEVGVDAVQLDDPWLALLVDAEYRAREGITDLDHEIEVCVSAVNAVVAGVEEAAVSVHLCHAHFNRRHATHGPYDPIIDALGEMRVGRFAIELATPDAGGIDVLARFPADKRLGLGCIDHTDRRVETPEDVVARVEAAMRHVEPERITLNPDCGFSPSVQNPMDLDEAYLKLCAMCEGARILRSRHR